MNLEIEAKFLNVKHDKIRKTLLKQGAVQTQSMRLMRRVVVHTEEMTDRNAFVRIRDEGSRTTLTYKQFDTDTIDGAKEYEVEVSDFDTTVNIFSAAGLKFDTFQESKRENWKLGNVEIMLDEWPWLEPFIEIEGGDEQAVRAVAESLDLDWSNAVFGGVANAYLQQYPHIGKDGVDEINHRWSVIRFSDPSPPSSPYNKPNWLESV